MEEDKKSFKQIYRLVRNRAYHVIKDSNKPGTVSFYVDMFLIGLILINVAAILLQSIEKYDVWYNFYFEAFEIFSVIVFSIEYFVRIWTCVEVPNFKSRIKGRFKFSLTPYAMIDFFAVIPFYIPFVGVDLRFLRILRLLRVFRVFKIARYLKAVNIIKSVIKDNTEELAVSFVFVLFLLLISSTMIYYIEHDIQPDAFGSIPQSMWWGVVTITTVGYGDVYPVTAIGKFFGGVIAILGIGVLALPTGIIASGFMTQINKKKKKEEIECPHCKEKFKV